MGLINALKRSLGFKTKRKYVLKNPCKNRKPYTKRNAEYWGTQATTVAQDNKKPRKRFSLEEMIFLVMNEHPHKAFTIEDLGKRVATLRGGVRQSRPSIGIRIADMAKKGKVRRLARGYYALDKQGTITTTT